MEGFENLPLARKIVNKKFSGQRKIPCDNVKLYWKFQVSTTCNKDFVGVRRIGLEEKKKKKKEIPNNNNNNNNKKKIQKAIVREFSIFDENSNKYN